MSSPENRNSVPVFSHRSCYVNFAEHLQNRWNPNLLYPQAPNRWSLADWRKFLTMLRSFGFNTFEYWLPPTLFAPPALRREAIPTEFARVMREVTETAHGLGLKTKVLIAVNTIGAEWFFACPHSTDEKQLIINLWRHWVGELAGTDIIGIFPGDPGGCNRNGCTHETFIDLSLELCELIAKTNRSANVELGTWGTPFSGWGSDLRSAPNWDGNWASMADGQGGNHIWHGTPERARAAMTYLLERLDLFPEECFIAINLGFSPDAGPTHGGEARAWAREIAKHRRIVTWDYSASEGELVCYPHWRLARMAARRRQERAAAPYQGGICYTMSPKLNLLTLYAGGRTFHDPDSDPDQLSRDFCGLVFGQEHRGLGELLEAFEIVPGWGHHPRRLFSREEVRAACAEMIDRLLAADMSSCRLPLFPDPEEYREDLLWFARAFMEMSGCRPDRARMRAAYWQRALSIYDHIPMSVDQRAADAARQFSTLLAEEGA